MGIQQGTDRSLRELALFAGAGGGILGGYLLGWQTVCAVEFDPYARDVLLARQNDGCLPPFPVWDDVRTFDGRPWRGAVDVVSGGFPCQDISLAGRGAGIDGEQSGLWGEMARIIGEVRPRFAFVENSPALAIRGLGRVLGDLADLGMAVEWGVLGAKHAGAPHQRARIWLVAHAEQDGRGENAAGAIAGTLAKGVGQICGQGAAQAVQPSRCGAFRLRGIQVPGADQTPWSSTTEPRRTTEPGMGGVVDGMAAGMDRLQRLGNGQVPAVVRLAWNTVNSYTDSPKGTASYV